VRNVLELKKFNELNQDEKLKLAQYIIEALTGRIGAKSEVDLDLIRKHAYEEELYIGLENAVKIEVPFKERKELYYVVNARNALVFEEFDTNKYVAYAIPYSTLPPFPFHALIVIQWHRRGERGYWYIEFSDGRWYKKFEREADCWPSTS
jgi:hypothetical protein